ncbi:hypothetical protein AB0L00_38470 [Actinoallomurus sp. NPDC052308]|uniref:hypothetical protein n=1 Tax=Actinoallomurus sp. NPDC052308 TaxID=3155530 RepID=UPI0034288D8E
MPILLKLFRRLVDYFTLGAGNASLDGFRDFLANRGDRLIIIPDTHVTGFDTVVEVTGGRTVRLTHPPEDLVFIEA